MSRTNKNEPPEHHDFKSTTDSTRNRGGKYKCGDHEPIQMEKLGETKSKTANRRKSKAENDKCDKDQDNNRGKVGDEEMWAVMW